MGGDAAEDGGLAAFCVRQSSLGRLGKQAGKEKVGSQLEVGNEWGGFVPWAGVHGHCRGGR